jgi:hypothetical protein
MVLYAEKMLMKLQLFLFSILFSLSGFAQVEDFGKKGWFGRIDLRDRAEAFMGGESSCQKASREEMYEVDNCLQNYALVDRQNLKDFDNLTEELIFMEAARRTHQVALCQEKLHKAIFKDANLRSELQKNAFAQFQHLNAHITKALNEYEATGSNLSAAKFAGSNYYEDRMAGVADEMAKRKEKAQQEFNESQEKLFDLVARIPLGNRPEMRDAMIKLLKKKKPISEKEFLAAYNNTLIELGVEAHKAAEFFNKLGHKDPTNPKGMLYTVDEDLKKSLARSGQIENVVHALGLDEKLADRFVCRAKARYQTGPMALTIAEIPTYFLGYYGLGRLGVWATVRGGMAASRMASSSYAGLRASSQLALFGLHSYSWAITAENVRQTCIPQEFMTGAWDDSCTVDTEVSGLYQEALSAQCLTNAALAVGPFMAFKAYKMGSKVLAAEKAAAQETGAVKPAEEPEIVVTAKRKRAPATLVVSGRKVNTEEFKKVQEATGTKLENPAIRHYALNELSTMEHLPAKARTKAVNALIVKINKWESPLNVHVRKLNDYHIKKFDADVQANRARVAREEPKLKDEEIQKRAEQEAFKTRERSLALRKMCSTGAPSAAMNSAKAKFTKYSLGVGLTSTLGNYALNHYNEVKDKTWFQRLGFEMVMSAIGSYTGSKVVTSDKGGKLAKIVVSNLVSMGTNSIEAGFYSYFFSDDKEKAAANMERIKKSPHLKEDLKELEKYLESRKDIEETSDNLVRFSSKYFSIITGKPPQEITLKEIESIDENKLKDPVIQEKLFDLMADKAYSDGAGHMKLGSKAVDRVSYNTLWNLGAVPLNLGIQLVAFKAVCLLQDKPAQAMSLFAAIQLSRQYGTGYFYYRWRKQGINQ